MRSSPRRSLLEPLGLFLVALVGSGAMWGRLFVTHPASHAVCGCGDPSLFQWFIAWPEHAIATGHSLVFSRDLFAPHGINLLSNTSVLALGVPLAPVTWLGGPILATNVALLLAPPVAVVTMDLLLSRLTPSVPARAVASVLYGFSPYVVASLAIDHLMTAWIGILPLIALGAIDAVSGEPTRSRRGQVLLAAAIVVQFFISTELLVLAAVTCGVIAIAWGLSSLAELAVTRHAPPMQLRRAVRLVPPVLVAGALLAWPAWYALDGPRALRGDIWGSGFNVVTGGSSLLDLLRPHVVAAKLTTISGYDHPLVQLQYVGWGLLGVALVLTVLRLGDRVLRVALLTCVGCSLLALSTRGFSLAPWQWAADLPLLHNVVQFRISVFALGAALVVLARGAGSLLTKGAVPIAGGVVALLVAAVPLLVPVVQSLPIRTVDVSVPAWWREGPSGVTVASYPFASLALQSPLTWQAVTGFRVAQLGGSGPGGEPSRAGADADATAVLGQLSNPLRPTPSLSVGVADAVRAMLRRDDADLVVIPVSVRGSSLVTGAPPSTAAVFFTEVLGEPPTVTDGAWVFALHAALRAPDLVGAATARRCAAVAAKAPGDLGACVIGIRAR